MWWALLLTVGMWGILRIAETLGMDRAQVRALDLLGLLAAARRQHAVAMELEGALDQLDGYLKTLR